MTLKHVLFLLPLLLAAALALASPSGATLAGMPANPATPPSPIDGGHIPFDPTQLRPGQPYPGAGYPWERVSRAAPAGWQPSAPPVGIDLDVTFISRTPKYKSYCVAYSWETPDQPGIPTLCPGTEDEQRWPAAGEIVTFTAHVVNKGTIASPAFTFHWEIDGVQVASGTLPALAAGAEATASTQWPWGHIMDGERVVDDHRVRFTVDPLNAVAETYESNNTLEDRTNALGFRIAITPAMVTAYNTSWNPAFSYSAEDWLQRQITAMNWTFANSIYPTTPTGATERVRIDEIVVTATPPINDRSSDGGWFVDADYRIVSGWYDPVADIDWALAHELSHQVGVIDLYQLNMNITSVHVLDRIGQPANFGFSWPRPDLMGGGDIAPHTDGHLYSSHGAAGFSSTKGYRRGYYGEYQFDIPAENWLLVLNNQGSPAAGVTVSLYQRNGPVVWPGDVTIDNVPEFVGATGADGRVRLANRQIIGGPWATATGHVLADNPFGVVDVVGGRNRFLVKLAKGSHEEFAWLDITDFNLAYWQGDTANHTFTVTSHVPAATIPAAPAGVTAQVANGQVTLRWQASAIPEVQGYYIYRATGPTYVYERISGRVTGASYVTECHGGDCIYAVTATDLDGRESGFSTAAWAPDLVLPSALVIVEEGLGGQVQDLPLLNPSTSLGPSTPLRVILDTHAGPLIRQLPDERYLGRIGSVHFGLTGSRYLGIDPLGRFLITDPGRQVVRVADAAVQPLFEFGEYGTGPGQFREPAGIATWGHPCTVEGPYVADSHTLLLLHFDGSYDGAQGEHGTVTGASFTVGRYDQALMMDGSDTLSYETIGNLNREAGAIEFWVRPNWQGNDAQDYVFFEAGVDWFNRMLIIKDGANNLRLIVWDSDHEYGVAYNVGHWQAGEWHHVATTWDANTLVLYVDGQAVSQAANTQPPDTLAARLSIGSTVWGESQADATIDEFRISDVPRVGNSDTCSYRILVADSGNDRIQAFDGAGSFISAYGTSGSGPGQFRNPQGLAVDDRGRVILADSDNNRLQLLGFDGQAFSHLKTIMGDFNGPTGVWAYGSDRILVADTGNNVVKELIPEGNTYVVKEHQELLSAPRGVAADRDGSLIVADSGNRRIVTIRNALPTFTPTPKISPTPTPTATPTPCSEQVLNGGFEADQAWTFPVTASRAGYTTAQAHAGARSARFGLLPGQDLMGLNRPAGSERNLIGEVAPDNASFSSGYQTVSIPAGAHSATLTFWYRPGSEATGGDYQRVMLLNPDSYTYIATLMKVLEDSDTWQQATFDLLPYRGRSMVLYFEVYNDNISAGPRTWMFLDDVSLQACTGATPTPTASPTPTVTPEGDLTLAGLVYDASRGPDAPIGGASVWATMCVPRTFTAETGPDGRYSLFLPGPYLQACQMISLGAWAPGYAKVELETTVDTLRANPMRDFGLFPVGISVNTTDDELNTDGDCSLREAIQAANTDATVDACPAGHGADTIHLPEGVYRLALTGAGEDANATGDLDILADLTLEGTATDTTVIHGEQIDRVLHVHAGVTARFSRLAIISGRTVDGLDDPVMPGDAESGGGIFNAGNHLILDHCAVTDNRTGDGGRRIGDDLTGGPGGDGGDGGGIFNIGVLTAIRSLIGGNFTGSGGSGTTGTSGNTAISRAGAGGGVFNHSEGEMWLDTTLVGGNGTGDGSYLINPASTNGGAGGDGAGIFNAGSGKITNSTLAQNRAGAGHIAGTHGIGGAGGAGGGIFNAGDLTVSASTMSDNEAGRGGDGGICGSGGHGGGIANGQNAALHVLNSTVSFNRSGDGGSALVSAGCHGGNGGGIFSLNELKIDSSTFSGNDTGLDGNGNGAGALYTAGAIQGGASGSGGGIFLGNRYGLLRNTILAGNTATHDGPECAGLVELRGHNLIQSVTGCTLVEFPEAGPNLLGVDPLLEARINYGGPTETHALGRGSPAINAGTCTTLQGDPIPADQRGVPRPQGAACDIGAYEEEKLAWVYLPLITR